MPDVYCVVMNKLLMSPELRCSVIWKKKDIKFYTNQTKKDRKC